MWCILKEKYWIIASLTESPRIIYKLACNTTIVRQVHLTNRYLTATNFPQHNQNITHLCLRERGRYTSAVPAGRSPFPPAGGRLSESTPRGDARGATSDWSRDLHSRRAHDNSLQIGCWPGWLIKTVRRRAAAAATGSAAVPALSLSSVVT